MPLSEQKIIYFATQITVVSPPLPFDPSIIQCLKFERAWDWKGSLTDVQLTEMFHLDRGMPEPQHKRPPRLNHRQFGERVCHGIT